MIVALRHMLGAVAGALGLLAATALSANAEKFAIVVAIEDYQFTEDVAYAKADADAIEDLLVNVHGVPRANVTRLDNASLAGLRSLFGDAGAPGRIGGFVRPGASELYVYFAGHGSREVTGAALSSTPYLLASDTDPTALRTTGYSLDGLVSQLRDLRARVMPEGQVTLILESCFSGRSNAGELVTGRSAPLHGQPVVVSSRLGEKVDGISILAAAQGDEYAVWDTQHGMSVFTDALVAGLYGEADDPQFGGDGDGTIATAELERFVLARIARRLDVVAPGTRQTPDFLTPNEVLLERSPAREGRSWVDAVKRRHSETIKATLLLAEPEEEAMAEYLRTCLYCPRKDELSGQLSSMRERAQICSVEETTSQTLLATGSAGQIEAFLGACTCCARRAELQRRQREQSRLAARTPAPSTPVAPPVPAQSPSNPQLSSLEDGADDDDSGRGRGRGRGRGGDDARTRSDRSADLADLTRRLQAELVRHGCLTGSVDGQWGPASSRALQSFAKATKRRLDLVRPSEAALEAAEAENNRVCASATAVRSAPAEPRPAVNQPSIGYQPAYQAPRTSAGAPAAPRSSGGVSGAFTAPVLNCRTLCANRVGSAYAQCVGESRQRGICH